MVSFHSKCAMADAVKRAYMMGEEDETLEPRVLVGDSGPLGRVRDGDAVIFYNIRGEREIELTRCFVDRNFDVFPIVKFNDLLFATMIEYAPELPVEVIFPSEGPICETLCEVLSIAGKRQVKITEAEKAIHIGYFFNGKRWEHFEGEDRIIVPTRKDVVLFDEAPEMSIHGIIEKTLGVLEDSIYDFIVVNFPNVDVVGHVENREAILKAVEAVDKATGTLVEAAKQQGVWVVITADHGTVEKWLYPDGSVDTGHTDSPVPFIIVPPSGIVDVIPEGSLIDVAPTVLSLFGLEKPRLMTGRSLIRGSYGCSGFKCILMIILDGWGYRKGKKGNLIASAHTPVMDHLLNSYPFSLLKAAGEYVGLPPGTVGNSEAGHLHLGAGRVILSDRLKIDRSVERGHIYKNETLKRIMAAVKERASALHLMGIVSFFSSHGSLKHLYALLEMAKQEGIEKVYIHAMLGRRGELPESGTRYIRDLEMFCKKIGVGKVVSVIGRYWSLDREENWDRIEKTYRMLVYGEGFPVFESN
ncbi:MAG: alkaline phosphatase family protein [Syntrophales bacterium]|nr:alkaline phosphatase family protein [Syntrophales bacterium]